MADNAMRTLTLAEAADYLGMHPDTVSRKAREGLIEYGQTDGGHYRFKREWLDAYLKENADKE